jgi:regulator of sigma E protease
MLTNEAVKSLKLTIRRGSEEFERSLTPEKPLQPSDAKPALGIVWLVGSTNITLVHPRPMDQIKESAGQIFATLGALFAKNSDVGVQQLGGAVMIIRVYTNLFDNPDGWRLVLWFSVVLNVNLAMLNLLPFPVLDGGHITLALLEAIRRRPVSARILQNLQGACAIFLIGFMLFIAFFDTGDWLRSARQDRSQPVVFAPKP